MFLALAHSNLDVFRVVKDLVKETYILTNRLPASEKYNMVQQIRRAVISVLLNLAEGCSRKSISERNRFFEISRGSMVEVDSVFEMAVHLDYLKETEISAAGDLLIRSFQMISKMIKK